MKRLLVITRGDPGVNSREQPGGERTGVRSVVRRAIRRATRPVTPGPAQREKRPGD